MKVFKQDGTTPGQGRVSTGETELTALLLPPTRVDVVLTSGLPEGLPEGDSEGEAPPGAALLEAEWLSTVVRVSVTGQMVVETAMVTTVVTTEFAGQSGTVGAHEVMVCVEVVKTVDVLSKLVVMVLVTGGGTMALLSLLWPAGGVLLDSSAELLLLSWPGETLLVLVTAGGVTALLLPAAGGVLVSAGGVLVSAGGVFVSAGGVEDDFTSEVVVVWAGGVAVPGVSVVLVLGGLVLEAVLQSKEMVGTWMLQLGLGLLACGGKTMVTFLAPPHWLLTTVVPDLLQALRCLQVEPSGIS